VSANGETVRQALEAAARRYHNTRRYEAAPDHRHWRFEYCPAEFCREARQALGMATPALPAAAPEPREPGCEG